MQQLTPIGAATAANPYPYYALLVAQRPFHYDAELRMWVAASAAAVEAALCSEALAVRPLSEPVPSAITQTPAGDLFGRFMRMRDGAYHAARKREASAALDRPPYTDPRWAQDCARAFPHRDLASFMHRFPAYAMARAAGLSTDDALCAADAAVEFARTLSSSAADALAGAFREYRNEAQVSNAAGFLFQSVDATAGLIGNTLCALQTSGDVPLEELVPYVARYDSPVQNTRRFAASDVTILGCEVHRGDAILVLIAAANHDPLASRSYTFGLGAHACPAERIACALALAAVREIHQLVDTRKLRLAGYRPAPNVRIPEFVREQASAVSPSR